jgi:hypothetical protein
MEALAAPLMAEPGTARGIGRLRHAGTAKSVSQAAKQRTHMLETYHATGWRVRRAEM